MVDSCDRSAAVGLTAKEKTKNPTGHTGVWAFEDSSLAKALVFMRSMSELKL